MRPGLILLLSGCFFSTSAALVFPTAPVVVTSCSLPQATLTANLPLASTSGTVSVLGVVELSSFVRPVASTASIGIAFNANVPASGLNVPIDLNTALLHNGVNKTSIGLDVANIIVGFVTLEVDCFPTSTILLSPDRLQIPVAAGSPAFTTLLPQAIHGNIQNSNSTISFAMIPDSGVAANQWVVSASVPGSPVNSGSVGATGTTDLNVLIDPTGLAAQSTPYVGTVHIIDTNKSQGVSGADLGIELLVTPGLPSLVVPPATVTFSAQQGSGDPGPATVPVTSSAGSIAFTATPSSNGNWLSVNGSVNAIALNTPANLAISAHLAGLGANTYSGTIQLAGPGTNATINVQLTVTMSALAPSIAQNGVKNAASGATIVAPGSWAAVFGSNLAPDTVAAGRQWAAPDFIGTKLPTILDNVRVTVGGQPAAISFLRNDQINLQVPDIAAGSAIPVVVTTSKGSSMASTVSVQNIAPALFPLPGTPYPVAQHADYSLVGTAAGFTPATSGETIILYGTGFGPTVPPVMAGVLVETPERLAGTVNVRVNGVAAKNVDAFLIEAGLVQLNVTLPDGIPAGDRSLSIDVGGVALQQPGMMLAFR